VGKERRGFLRLTLERKEEAMKVIEVRYGSDPWQPLQGWWGSEVTEALLQFLKARYRRVRIKSYGRRG